MIRRFRFEADAKLTLVLYFLLYKITNGIDLREMRLGLAAVLVRGGGELDGNGGKQRPNLCGGKTNGNDEVEVG